MDIEALKKASNDADDAAAALIAALERWAAVHLHLVFTRFTQPAADVALPPASAAYFEAREATRTARRQLVEAEDALRRASPCADPSGEMQVWWEPARKQARVVDRPVGSRTPPADGYGLVVPFPYDATHRAVVLEVAQRCMARLCVHPPVFEPMGM